MRGSLTEDGKCGERPVILAFLHTFPHLFICFDGVTINTNSFNEDIR